MVAALHAAGIKLVVDIVPNHSSNRHVWFQQALAAGPGSPERERYVFRHGRGEHGELPPSDWTAMFGGSTWEPVGDGEWYLHLFAPEQPDWNWNHPDVREDHLRTLRFWADRGVDGFRIDVANSLAKDLSEPLPTQAELADLVDGAHRFFDRDEVHDVYVEWRKLFDEYDPPRTAVAEAWVPPTVAPATPPPRGWARRSTSTCCRRTSTPPRSGRPSPRTSRSPARPAVPRRGCCPTTTSSGTPAATRCRPVPTRTRGCSPTARTPNPTPSVGCAARGPRRRSSSPCPAARTSTRVRNSGWPRSRTSPRPTCRTRRGCAPAGSRRAATAAASRCRGRRRDRRTVSAPAGAHLPQPSWFADVAADRQDGVEGSTLELYRQALATRRRLQGAEELEWLETPAHVVAFTRPGGWTCLTNFGDEPVDLPAGRVVLASGELTDGRVPADTTVWVEATA